MNTPEAEPQDVAPEGVAIATAPPPSQPAPAQHAPAPAAAAPSTGTAVAAPNGATMDLLSDVKLDVTVELGRRKLTIGELQRLAVGSVLELDTLAGDPLKIYANGRLIATGEAVVVDGQFGVRVGALAGSPAD